MKKIVAKLFSLFARRGLESPAEEIPRLEVETLEVSASNVDLRPMSEITSNPETKSEEATQAQDTSNATEAEATSLKETPEVVVDAEIVVDEAGERDDHAPADAKSLEAAGGGNRRPVVMAYRADGKQEKRHRFGEYVHRKGLISRDALYAASLEQEVTGAKIGQILVSNGFLSDKDRIEAVLATEYSRISEETVSKTKIPVEVLTEYSIIISAEQEEKVYVASPEDERLVKTIVKEYYPHKEIEMVSYDASAQNGFLASMRKMSSIDDPANAEQLMLDRIVYNALTEHASDIHIEPRATSYSILFRKDGVRRLVHTGNMTEYQVLIAKIKDRAAMDLAERRKPQDGGFKMEYAGKMIDLRIATAPLSEGGEKCVIRLLDSDRVQPSLEKLGISDVSKWRKGLRHQDGMCIICGPTGSGKTTTLNASVREMDRFGRSIYSIEDPVEYRIPYVSQVGVNTQVGLDFAAGVRAFMRMDPDVMIVGEVRDTETAINAVKAAETGHLVLATLHAGSISGAISRLKELGIEPHEVRYLIRAIMVQSLVRTVCTECHGAEPERSACKCCEGTGYKGRTVVSECEYFDGPAAVGKIIPEKGKDIDVTWVTKEEDAVNKMYAGVTDYAELERVFGPSIERYIRKEDVA